MYNNVSKVIKAMAIVLGWLLLVGGVVAFFLLKGNGVWRTTAYICLGGGILSFLMSWVLYGFGQLVEDVHKIRENTENKKK